MNEQGKMQTPSRYYGWFTWLHINSYAGLVAAGVIFAAVLRIAAPGRLKNAHRDYREYLAAADLPPQRKSCLYACIAAKIIYGAVAKEFFLYDFMHLNDAGRREYITEINRYNLYGLFNGAKKRREMESKYMAYQAFRKYYQREAIYIGADTGMSELEAFFADRTAAILKPNMSGCGRNVEIIRLSDFTDRNAAFSYILGRPDSILEELVVQAEEMRRLHPKSVNTVRVYAVRLKDRIETFGVHLRIGVGDSVVDNAAAGGIIVSINQEGIAWTQGKDEFFHDYLYVSDTDILIPGLKLPEWDAALRLVSQAMEVYPDIRFVGWDLAYSEKGWVIIEANENGQFYGAQILHHRGFLKDMLQYAAQL